MTQQENENEKTEERVTSVAPSQQQGIITATTRRVFSRPDDAPTYPLFVNAVEFSALGMDVIMDGGAVAPESVNEAQGKAASDGKPLVLDVHVAFRAAMSLQTAVLMYQRLGEILGRAKEMNLGDVPKGL